MSNLLQIHEPGQTPDPHANTVAVGIDLGTTHSVVSVMHDGQPVAIENAQGRSIIPSIVRFGKGVDDYISSIKRLMGKSPSEARALLPHLAESIVEKEGEKLPYVQCGSELKTAIELSAEILSYLKGFAEDALGKDVREAVITVPAYFDDAARVATRDAAKLAGLEVLRLINEPTAAAMSYGVDSKAEGTYAVYDLGGGTFDISILNLEGGVFQVLSTAGDTSLGGDDVDALIAEAFLHYVSENSTKSVAITAELMQKARAAKEALSIKQDVVIEYSGVSFTLTAQALDKLLEPLVARTLSIVQRAMSDADLTFTDIHGVVLVGGSTRLLAVKNAVAALFSCEIMDGIDPDRVVSYGAALQAHNLTEAAGEHLLIDVVPLSLGIETMGGMVEKVIWRNSPIPTAVAQEFTTYKDGQTAIAMHIVQGERELVNDCRSLARFTLRGLPPKAAGAVHIKVTFSVDVDGLLTVSAEEVESGLHQEIEVKPTYGLSVDDMEKMLRAGIENAKEDIVARLLAEAKMEAARTMSDVEAALSEDQPLLDAKEMHIIRQQFRELSEALSSENRELIDALHNQLKHFTASFAQKRMDKAIGKALKGNRVEEMDS